MRRERYWIFVVNLFDKLRLFTSKDKWIHFHFLTDEKDMFMGKPISDTSSIIIKTIVSYCSTFGTSHILGGEIMY